jgi:hypothetical protein
MNQAGRKQAAGLFLFLCFVILSGAVFQAK